MISETDNNPISKQINASFLSMDKKERVLGENGVREIIRKSELISEELTLIQT